MQINSYNFLLASNTTKFREQKLRDKWSQEFCIKD